jgi:predicted HicB family RNase H-like nuclease
MARLGRPKLLAKERQSRLIAIRLTPAEHKQLERFARKAKISVSAYVRGALGLKTK